MDTFIFCFCRKSKHDYLISNWNSCKGKSSSTWCAWNGCRSNHHSLCSTAHGAYGPRALDLPHAHTHNPTRAASRCLARVRRLLRLEERSASRVLENAVATRQSHGRGGKPCRRGEEFLHRRHGARSSPPASYLRLEKVGEAVGDEAARCVGNLAVREARGARACFLPLDLASSSRSRRVELPARAAALSRRGAAPPAVPSSNRSEPPRRRASR